jgi:prepilin-type N-terminal cleavage/methylation domain-containing protein
VQQNQAIKGFTIIELLVVLVLIGIISAVGYPSMSGWRIDRDVRSATEKISSLFTNITIRTKNNSYPFVQVNIKKPLSGSSKGMPQELFNDKLNNEATISCTDNDWDDDDKVQTVSSYQLVDEVFINMSSGSGSVCFSNDGAYFDETLSFPNVNAPGSKEGSDVTKNYVIV